MIVDAKSAHVLGVGQAALGEIQLDVGRSTLSRCSWVLGWHAPRQQGCQVARGTAEEAFLWKGSQHLSQRMGQEV